MKSQILFIPKSDRFAIKPFERWAAAILDVGLLKEHNPQKMKSDNQKKQSARLSMNTTQRLVFQRQMRLGVLSENVGNDNKRHGKMWFFEPDFELFFSHSN